MANPKKDAMTAVPYGLVIMRSWLINKQGVERHKLDNWVKSERLTSILPGVYQRPDTKLAWQAVVASLQYMGSDLCPGGLTALELHGLNHYLPLSSKRSVHLYGQGQLPAWANKLLPDVTFVRHGARQVFGDSINKNGNRSPHGGDFTTTIDLGIGEQTLTVSTPERAFFEVLADIPQKISFEHADQLLQGLTSLSPRRLNALLECCRNIKIRRLFLWFAERHRHPWFENINLKHFNMQSPNLGSGKRVVYKSGKLDPKYLITIPPEMYRPQESYG